MATKKQEMQDWLTGQGVAFPSSLTKPRLYELVKQQKETLEKTYEVDSLLSRNGHTVARLPPYHCDLNPIELIWGDLKGFIARENHTFKAKDVKSLIDEGFSKIDPLRWQNCCRHVLDIEEAYWKKDNIQKDTVNPIVVHIGNDSDEEDDDDDDEEEEEEAGEEEEEEEEELQEEVQEEEQEEVEVENSDDREDEDEVKRD